MVPVLGGIRPADCPAMSSHPPCPAFFPLHGLQEPHSYSTGMASDSQMNVKGFKSKSLKPNPGIGGFVLSPPTAMRIQSCGDL